MAEKEYIERGAVVAMLRAITIRITPIEENRNMFYHDSGWNGASVAAKVEIGKIPAADVVEVRHGEWKPVDPDSDVRFFCSECETEVSTSWDYDRDDMWRYCPSCGAKMDGAADNNVGDKGR